jgi:hypothetical protein
MQDKDTIYRWVRHEGQILHNVGIRKDGSLVNPNGYPDDVVRAAVIAAIERRRVRRSNSAKRAAETRRQRREKKVYEIVKRIQAGQDLRSLWCRICRRALSDPESKARGIGSECWQDVMKRLSSHAHRAPVEPTQTSLSL